MFWPFSCKPWTLTENPTTTRALYSYQSSLSRNLAGSASHTVSGEFSRFIPAADMNTFTSFMERIYPDTDINKVFSAIVQIMMTRGVSPTKDNLAFLQSATSVGILMPTDECEKAIHFFFSPSEASKARAILDKLVSGLVEDMVTAQDILDAVTN